MLHPQKPDQKEKTRLPREVSWLPRLMLAMDQPVLNEPALPAGLREQPPSRVRRVRFDESRQTPCSVLFVSEIGGNKSLIRLTTWINPVLADIELSP